MDAGYAGYRVTNNTGSTQSDLWTEVSGFTGGKVTLANSADSAMQISSLTNGSTGASFFLLKASGASATAQTHTVKVYNHRPDLAGSTVLYTCDFTFSSVKETQQAAANKIMDTGLGSAAAIEASTTTPQLGQTMTITVEGETGTIGAGSSPDNDIVWLVPAATSTFPTRILRLEGTSVTFDANKNWSNTADESTYTNQLLISGASTAPNLDKSQYRITYTYRVIGLPPTSLTAVSTVQIASGSQIKHSANSSATLSFSSLAINAALTKSVTSTTGLTTVTCGVTCVVPGGTNGETYTAVPYRMTATSSDGSTQLTIDDFIDTPAVGIIYKPGSSTVTDIGRTGVAISDPVYSNTDSSYHFTGPFLFNLATSASVSYTMWVPAGTYVNTAYAKLGDVMIGATSSAKSRITVSSTGTSSVNATQDTVGFSVDASTQPATSIGTTSATLNGIVDPNGTNPLTGQFQYGTDPNLVGASTVTATTPASGKLDGLTSPTAVSVNVTGLSSNTTYYFRVVAGSTQGQILSFTTTPVTAPPTVTTQPATSISGTGATLNGDINPNLTSVTAIQFIYGTSATLASGNTTTTIDDGSGTAPLTAAGASTQSFSKAITGLTIGTTYYYKICACTSAPTGTYPNITCASFVDDSIVSFVAANPPTVTTTAATLVTSTTATLNGIVNANGSTASVSFAYGTVSDLSSGTTTVADGTATGTSNTNVSTGITGLSPNTTYYFRVSATNSIGSATDGILSFTTSLASRTLTIDAGSYNASGYSMIASPPTITSTASAGAGTKSYSSSTPSVCTINSSTGLVTFVAAGTCTIGASIASDGTYAIANATPISFTISLATRTLSLNTGDYAGSYTMVQAHPIAVATPSAGSGTITYASSTPAVCTVNSSTGVITFVSVGTCTVSASIASDGTYASANTTSSISFNITLASRTLTIDSGSYNHSGYSMTDAPPTITSTASAGAGTKSYSSSTPSVCTINSSTGLVTFVAAGTCTIGASITSDGTYASANASTISFDVTLASRTLSLNTGDFAASYTMVQSHPNAIATPSAGTGTKTYTSSTPGVCTVNSSSGVITFVSVGTCTITASIASDGTYASANASSDISFQITLASRTLTIDSGSYNHAGYGLTDTPPTITSTPSAGTGTKSYTSSTPGVCTIDSASGVVTFVSVGTCTIAASIAADGTYDSANASTISFNITLASRTLTIDSGSYNHSGYSMTDAPPTITSTPSAGGGMKTYTSLTPGVCTIDSMMGTVAFVSAGTCTIVASITSDGTYVSTDANSISFPVSLAARTLSLNTGDFAASYTMVQAHPDALATPSVGTGTITYTSTTPGVCTVNSSTGVITFVSAGTCTITASIASDGTYASANASSNISFEITLAPRTLTIDGGSYNPAGYKTTDAPPTLTSTPSNGGGTKNYSSSTPLVCMIDSVTGAVTFITSGTCTLSASITNDGTYDAANADSISFNVTLAPRTLSLNTGDFAASYTMVQAHPDALATPSAGAGTKTYSSATQDVCTVDASSGVITFVKVGACIISASIAADGTYDAANTTSSISFEITLAPRTLTIDSDSYNHAGYTTTDATPTITSTPSAGGGTKTYMSSTMDVCTIDENTGVVTFLKEGACEIMAMIDSDGVYQAENSETITFDISNVPLILRTLTIDSGSYNHSGYSLVNTPPTITSTPSIGTGTKTYESVTPDVCTIDSVTGVVTFVTTGTCTIGARISSDGTYTSATASTISFVVTLASRTLTIDSGSYNHSGYNLTDASPTLTSTPSAGGGTKSYSSSTPAVCTIDSVTGKVTFVSAGTCILSASITGDGTYDSANSDSISFDIGLTPRTLSLNTEDFTGPYTMVQAHPDALATPSIGTGTKTYTSLTLDVCTVNASSGVITFVSVGTCTITASIASDGTYASANASSNISFEITLAPRTLTVDPGSYNPSGYSMTDAPPTISSTPSAGGGTKSYTSSTPSVCTIDSVTGVVTFISAGTCTLSASITNDGTYDSADSNTISFDITLASRTLSLNTGDFDETYTMIQNHPSALATPSAGAGTITYTSSTLAVCTVNASTGVITFVSAGTCTITASIAADGTYASANASSNISFEITLAPRTLTIDSGSYNHSGYTSNDHFNTISGCGNKELHKFYTRCLYNRFSYRSGNVCLCGNLYYRCINHK